MKVTVQAFTRKRGGGAVMLVGRGSGICIYRVMCM